MYFYELIVEIILIYHPDVLFVHDNHQYDDLEHHKQIHNAVLQHNLYDDVHVYLSK